jgi:hypothetical protein
MRRDSPLLALSGAFLAGCAGLLGVQPLSGDDGGADTTVPEAGPGQVGDCTAVWVDASGGVVPPGAVNADPIDAHTVTIYVCRVASGSDLIPGKLRPDYGCYYGQVDAGEVLSTDYQVLVPPAGCTASWAYAPCGVAPANAVVTGQDSQGALYSCKVIQPASDEGELGHAGYGTSHNCLYSLSTVSFTSTDFDELVLQ